MSLFSYLKPKEKLEATLEGKPELNHFQVGQQTLPIVRTSRKKSIALKKRPSGIAILVPNNFSNKRLSALLASHHEWLEKTVKALELRHPACPSKSLFLGREGDVLEFFGVQNTFRIQPKEATEHGVADVQIEDEVCTLYWDEMRYGTLNIDASASPACQHIQAFMKTQAAIYLKPKLAHYAQQIGVQPKSLTVKGYKSRWGSCYSDGRIQFNWRLMQAPAWVIDYVVVHELCHLVHANHSKAFWDLVKQHYPQTPQAKLVMKTHGSRWIQLLV